MTVNKGGSFVALWVPDGVDPQHATRILGATAAQMADSLDKRKPSMRGQRVPVMALDGEKFDRCVAVGEAVNVDLTFARLDEELYKIFKDNPFIARPRGM
ncbi:MAG: hypothetical protein WAP74_04775 [Patescibacteria group bacterium]